MAGVLLAVLVMGGLAYGLLLNRGAVEWACGALSLALAGVLGYLAIYLTLNGAPPILVAVLGILAVVLPTWLFGKTLRKTDEVLKPMPGKRAKDNREMICHAARDYGVELVQEEERETYVCEERPEEAVKKEVPREREERSIGQDETRDPVSEEISYLIEAARKEREKKANRKGADFSYEAMLAQGDRLYERRCYILARRVYEQCKSQARNEQEAEAVRIRLEQCKTEQEPY